MSQTPPTKNHQLTSLDSILQITLFILQEIDKTDKNQGFISQTTLGTIQNKIEVKNKIF
jgi:hypothetical protein